MRGILQWIAKDITRGVDYYIGTDSFAAILRYNRSYFYAAAVTLLSYELEKRSEDMLHRRAEASAPADAEDAKKPASDPAQ